MNAGLENLRDQFSSLDEKFRAREFRERIMLVGMALACVFFVIDRSAIQPISVERNRISAGMDRIREDLVGIKEEMTRLTNVELTDEERRVAEELGQLRRQIDEISSRMGSEIARLIPPREIVSVLEELLAEDGDLKLVSLQSQTPERLGADYGLYRHGLRIEIEGDFRSTLRYLQRLEHSEWNLLWDRLEYRVQSFPTATITIDLHTLSEQEEWIGV